MRCGLTRDFEAPVYDEQAITSAVKGFGSVVSSQVEVQSICEQCAKSDATAIFR